VRTPAITPLLF